MAGWSSEGLGRKPTLIISFLPNVFGYLLVAVSWFTECHYAFKTFILAGRFLAGFAMGWSMLTAPVSQSTIIKSLINHYTLS